jgi:formyltetrahydrofolate deformylase
LGWLLPSRLRQGRQDRRVIACYITADPDTGPIVNQDISHATHRDTVDDLTSYAHEVERRFLARAIRWHLEDCMLVEGERTTIFERD